MSGVRFRCAAVFTSFQWLESRRLLAAPAAPVINEPEVNGQVVSPFDVHMEVDATLFSDADGHTHKFTTWQIRETAANGGAAVWQALNVDDPLSKVHLHLGDGAFVGTLAGQTALLGSRGYVLHATFTDSNNEVSPTSQRSFTTAAPTTPVPGEGTWIVREGYRMELAAPAGAFRLPVNVAFIPNPGPNPTDPLYYVTELYGSIKVVNRAGQMSTYATGLLDYNPQGPISGTGEQGLTGIAVDPQTGDLFVGMLWNNGTSDATRGGATLHYPKVERLHSNDGGRTMATRTIIRNMQPETQGQSHQISNISIGPDDKLYVHMGDGFNAATATNLEMYRGKVLRMNKNGTPVATGDPAGANPFYNGGTITARDFVYTYGHRNPFGGAWRASNGKHWVVENGNSLDRMVDLTSGTNYGWTGNDSALSANSKYVWNPSQAPVNIAFVQPQTFGGSLFPAGSQDDAFVTNSGPTYAPGPQSLGKTIVQFTNLDTLVGGKISTPPVTLLKYNGTGRATLSALAAGPDGLYFSDLYRDDGVGGATAAGSNVYRLRYVDFQPDALSATAGHGQVTLTWANDPLSAGTNLYRYVNHGDAPVLIASNVAGTSFVDDTALAGVAYHYVARAANAGGESNDSNEVHATATIPTTLTGTVGDDRFYLKRAGDTLDIWVGSDGVGEPTHSVLYSAAPHLTFNGQGGDDRITVDNAAGNAVPVAGFGFDGGGGSDAVRLLGSSGNDAVRLTPGVAEVGGQDFTYTVTERVEVTLGTGADMLAGVGGAVGVSPSVTLALNVTGGGSLTMAPAAALPEGAVVTVAAGTTFDVGGQDQQIGSLGGAGRVINGGATAATLALGGSGANSSFAGVIADGASASLALRKSGAGTLTLSGQNTFTGTTRLDAGTLQLNGALAGGVTLAAGATLTGGGTVGGNLAGGGAVRPGSSPGRLAVLGSYDHGAAAVLHVELGGPAAVSQHDRLDVTGAVTLGGALDASLNFAAEAGRAFVILQNSGTDPITGAFAGFPEGSTLTTNGRRLRVSYTGGDGNDVTLTVLSVTVTGVFVGSSAWTSFFNNFLQSSGQGEAAFGFRIDAASHATPLPWTNVNRLSVRFSEPVTIADGAMTLRGVRFKDYGALPMTYDAATFTATWSLPANLLPEKLLTDLRATGVTDASGNALDGEWANPAPASPPAAGVDAFPSGDGAPGGDFRFQLNVLPGDANRSGGTTGLDVLFVRASQSGSVGTPIYSVFKDLDGNGAVQGFDILAANARQGFSLPVGEPAVPSGDAASTVFIAPRASRSPALLSGGSRTVVRNAIPLLARRFDLFGELDETDDLIERAAPTA